MAETRYYDCPECGEKVIGYRKFDDGEKAGKAIMGGGAALIGGLLAGPLGALAGFALGKYAGDKAVDAGDKVQYSFKCPRCGHEFVRWFPN